VRERRRKKRGRERMRRATSRREKFGIKKD
jgi:hypothetical protein